MRDQNDRRSVIQSMLDRRQCGLDPTVIGDRTVFALRNVKVYANQALTALEIEIFDSLLSHISLCISMKKTSTIASSRTRDQRRL